MESSMVEGDAPQWGHTVGRRQKQWGRELHETPPGIKKNKGYCMFQRGGDIVQLQRGGRLKLVNRNFECSSRWEKKLVEEQEESSRKI